MNQIERLIAEEATTPIGKSEDEEEPLIFYQHDKHYNKKGHGQQGQVVTLVLYAQIGTHAFDSFHAIIKNTLLPLTSQYAHVDYILRHNYDERPSGGHKVSMAGYGVELDIKNVEYKATDDANINASPDHLKQKQEQQHQQHEQVKPQSGFMFDKLNTLYPHLSERLGEFRKHLIEEENNVGFELAPLKAWQMQDLSLQAAQRLVDEALATSSTLSANASVLGLWEDLAQNYPVRSWVFLKKCSYIKINLLNWF